MAIHSLRRYTPLLLFALNLLISWRFLNTEFIGHFDSIEPFFYAIADHIRAHPFDGGWMPEWNCGIPFRTSYQPLLHYLVAGWSGLLGWSSARGFHFVFALLYSAGPVTLFYLVRRLSKSHGTALIAALLYSLWSPSAWLLPEVARDIDGLLHARRLQTAAVYGNSPYVVALTFLPVAVLMIDRAVERLTPGRIFGAALAIVTVPLVNIPGALSLAMALVAYCVATGTGTRLRRFAVTVGASVLGFLLAAPFLPPSSLLLTVLNTRWMDESGQMTPYKFWLLAGGALVVLAADWGLRRMQAASVQRFAFAFTLITCFVVLGRSWGGISLIAQPVRFHLAMEMALVILVASLVGAIRIQNRLAARVALVTAAFAVCWQIGEYRLYARHVILRGSVEKRSEYKIARWLKEHARGNRAMVPGSISFWLNAFTGTPQVIGCCDQNTLFRAPQLAKYMMGTDDGAGARMAEISIAWLQTLGVRYVALCGPRSTEMFHETKHFRKFDGVLRRVWQDGDDAIFEVPGQTESLAHWVAADETVDLFPVNGIEVGPLTRYAGAVGNLERPRAAFQWLDTRRARIEGAPRAGDLLSIQVPFHEGWTARDGAGKVLSVGKDALGFLLLDPKCGGACKVNLEFTGGREAQILALLCGLTWAGFAGWAVRKRVGGGITLDKVKLA